MPKKFDLEQIIPKFKYPIVKELYYHDLFIDRQILRNIIRLGEKVIPDLEAVLSDVIEHSEIYANKEGFNWYTPTHALHLLAELKAERSLPKILEVFRQDEDFLEFWFGDSLNEEMWEVIYKCGQNSLDLMGEFLKDQSIWIYSRSVVSSGVMQIALHHTDRQLEVVELFKQVIDAIIPLVKHRNDEGYDDAKETIAWYVSDLIDLNDASLKDYLLKLFDLKVVETAIVAQDSIQEHFDIDSAKEIKSIYEHYDELEHIYKRLQALLFNFSKVGRNDPCPCGAKKPDGNPVKFKKCHYLKQ